MADLLASRSITLNAQTQRLQSPKVTLGKLTSVITIKLRFPTTAQPLAWTSSGVIRVKLVMVVDGVEYVCQGRCSGGIHTNPLGEEIPEYVLTFFPPVLFGDKAREYLATATQDAEGYYYDVPLSRIGETGTTVEGYLVLERGAGTINTVVTVAATVEAPAPRLAKYHNSVAYDAATSGSEDSGDGVLSVSHTAAGSNRAAFIAVGHVHNSAALGASATYGGSAATELWDANAQGIYQNAAYRFVAPPTSSTAVVGTLSGSTGIAHQFVGVVTFTGVDQTTPVGTASHYETEGAAGASRTVTGVASDDMVVDFLVSRPDTPVIGADQTLRLTVDKSWPVRFRVSTQPGSAGGVMSWTFTGGADWQGVYYGAVVFKAAAGGGPITATVNQASESDTAQAITVNPKRRLVNQTTETDLAQALTKRKTLAVGQATETDAAQALTVRKALAIGQTTETDSAQAITARKTRILVQATETDLAQPVTRSTPGSIIVPVGQAAETDQAQPVTVNPQRRLISQASETNQAQPLTARKLQTLGIAIESDLAQALTRHKVKTLAQALETDLALAVSWAPKRRLVGQALELDEALPVGVVHGEQIPVLILPATTRVYRIDARARLFVLRVTK